ncbi:ABC transporter ATP-binding protein [Azospirillum rugosum]|uniref:ATP-binding cassette subfamily B protein n=1 Tax=Azospirillum rugosum TaxID=416170 RepID=A0ABS4SDG8_9PROT|nr:ABC transporter ATP-binding protein [Azospirillum rugosum]MBP2290450.1 ATP-binding cassette subfamily B protein [Azospirillum rugosum]MDQ0527926.1 ATP-binding cassette subfamily B protein [Azospirillum rugosum]
MAATPSSAGLFSLYARVFREAKRFRPQLAGLLLLGVLGTPIGLLMPLPVTIAVDTVIGGKPLPGPVAGTVPEWLQGNPIVLAVGLVVVAALLTQLHGLADRMLRDWTGQRMVADFRAKLFLHAQRLALVRHDSKGISDALNRIEDDASAIQWQISHVLLPFVTSAAYFAGMVWVTALINAKLAIVALAVSPLFALLTALSHHRLRSRWDAVCEKDSAAKSVLHETLSALRVVRAFGQEEREVARFAQRTDDLIRSFMRAALAESGLGFLVSILLASGTAAVLWIGVTDVQAGALTVGELLLALSYLAQLYQPLQNMGHQVAAQQKLMANLRRAFSLLDETADPAERPHATPMLRARGDVAFSNVSFDHGTGRPIVQGMTFAIPAGSRVGIVGKSGAGKSSLVGLLTRLYDPQAGTVYLDGEDLRDLRLADLRRQFAIVGQDTILFSTTVAANIAYGRPDATMNEIVAAAKAADAHDFILRLPAGYDTPVGERGMRFSGGERQRIALARAFLCDAPILILDEPTSAVDLRTEQAIMDGVERLMDGRTTFMITHRLATLRDCDMLIEMEAGRITNITTDVRRWVSGMTLAA